MNPAALAWIVAGMLAIAGLGGSAYADAARPTALQGVGIDQRLDQPLPLDLSFRDETGRVVRLGDFFGRRPVVLALVWLFGRRGFAGRGANATASVPAFYERALRLLARRGLSPAAAETARQFAARVGVTAPERAEPFARLTRHYERARFGATALSETEWQDVTLALDTLAAAR